MKRKDRIKQIWATMETLREEIKMIQEDCPHTDTFEEYRWYRPGAGCTLELCSDCDATIRNIDAEMQNTFTTTTSTDDYTTININDTDD